MQGLLVIFFMVAVAIGVQILKKIAESQQNQNDGWDGEGSGDGEWTAWKNAQKRSSPHPPARSAARPRSAQQPRPATRPQPAPQRMTAKQKLQEVLREAQRALEQPKTAPAIPGPHALPGKGPAQDMTPETSAGKSAAPVAAQPDVDQAIQSNRRIAAESLGKAFTDMPTGTQPAATKGVKVRLRGTGELRRAIILREVLDRPRAFDM